MSTLGSLLVKNRVVGVVDIEKAFQRQVIYGGDLATNLLELSIAKENDIAKYAGQAFGMPVLEPEALTNPTEKVVKMLPWAAANEHQIVPVRIDGDKMIVAASAPLNVADLSEIAFLLGVEFSPHLVLEFRLAIALQRFFGIPMSTRFRAMHKRLAEDIPLDAPPLVPSPDQDAGLLRAATETTAEANARGEAAVADDEKPADEPGAADPVAHDSAAEPANATTPDDEAEGDTAVDVEKPAPAPSVVGQNTGVSEAAAPSSTLDNAPERDATSLPFEAPTVEHETVTIPPDARPSHERVTIPSAPPEEVSGIGSGSLDIDAAAARLEQAAGRDDILRILMELVGNVFEFSMLFVIQGKTAKGHSVITDTTEMTRIEGPTLPIDNGGMFETAFTTHSIYLGSPGTSATDKTLFDKIERSRPKNCAILPVVIRGRVILLLYGDSGAMGVKANHISELSRLTHLVAEAFDRILMEKKYGKYRAQVSRLPSRPAHQAFSKVPKEPVQSLASSAAWYRAGEEDHSGKVRAQNLAPSSRDESWDTEADAVEGNGGTVVADPLALVQQKPRAERYDQTVPTGIKYYKYQDDEVTTDDNPPVEEENLQEDAASSGVAVRTPRIISVKQGKPRSVEVNMQEEIDRLVERLLDPAGMDTAALTVLLGMGEAAIEKLIAHFPGPLNYDRHRETGKLLRVDKHGPLLRALTKFGEVAVPHLLPLFDSRDSDVRFYATFLFSTLKYPQALDALTSRLFDTDRQISAIAIDVLRGFSAYPEFRWSMQKVVDLLDGPSRDLETKRIAAKALGELGTTQGIESLIRMLESVDSKLVKHCHRALVKICFTDFGFSGARWLEWYESDPGRHRIEWAIDGLTHQDEEIRQNAVLELGKLIPSVMEGESVPGNEPEFKELQSRLRSWWESEGREIHHFDKGE